MAFGRLIQSFIILVIFSVALLGCVQDSHINNEKIDSCNGLIVEVRAYFYERPYLLERGMGIDHLSEMDRSNLKARISSFSEGYDECYLEQVNTGNKEGYLVDFSIGNSLFRMYNLLVAGVIDNEFKERTFIEMKEARVYEDFRAKVLGH